MDIYLDEVEMYRDFDELAADLLNMANELIPDKLIFLSTLTDTKQIVLKVMDHHTDIAIKEGMQADLPETACSRIDFEQNEPLVFEDISQADLGELKTLLLERNIQSYMGVPITLRNGETFGTLCAVKQTPAVFSAKSIKMFQRLAKMFSYYLELERKALRDSLTGLYNREFLDKTFGHTESSGGALFFIDLDGFKQINDSYGHDTGDQLLKEVAERIRSFMGTQSGYAVRLGGDEFILCFTDLATEAHICEQAEGLLAQFAEPLLKNILVSASIGIAPWSPADKGDLNQLLKKADSALYDAKAGGKNTYRISGHQDCS
ncbi:diguanylate cyclase [Bacillus mangrovi]|uniref:Diguanylate cyclase n=1 Tax=Metabacillus mangrovi TaxID=1491830 RepID=A0A7X2S7Y3_9BACI|nr:sensor domain-containing diguanylate cyclase [Metabacillus mangrovi]MTH54923.1 diguanylate cyclase [Metabacillus mangrovi]